MVRLSGAGVTSVGAKLLNAPLPPPRTARLARFYAADGQPLDQGLALYFPAPGSFTGEDVLELHAHGSPVVLDQLLNAALIHGARMARPGEFSERAFLNGKLDLTQAEAIADLINSTTLAQARLASRSLQGAFAQAIDQLLEGLIALRVMIEADLDFADEALELADNSQLQEDLAQLIAATETLLVQAQQGERVREGLTVVIAGAPNAGKSSLLNALCGQERAIVTAIPGTTRDLLHSDLVFDGLPLRLTDTAGLRSGGDAIEQEGMRRARHEISQADHLLWVFDAMADPDAASLDQTTLPAELPLTLIRNKIDCLDQVPRIEQRADGLTTISLSATTGAGLELLRDQLKAQMIDHGSTEGLFSARRRHLDALERALTALHAAAAQLIKLEAELVAEELRQAQQALGEITGVLTSDELLGRIFAEFCIGK